MSSQGHNHQQLHSKATIPANHPIKTAVRSFYKWGIENSQLKRKYNEQSSTMSFCFHVQWFSLVFALATFPGMHAVEFIVRNEAKATRGGRFFKDGIGNGNAKEVMKMAADFIWETFRQESDNPEMILYPKKDVETICLFIDRQQYSTPYVVQNEIHFSEVVILEFIHRADEFLFSPMIYRLMTRILQWDDDAVPPGLREGIGYYIALKAGYIPSDFRGFPKGERWDGGNYVTAKFLIYCEKRRPQFVADLNAEIKNGYKESLFKQFLNKDVEELWKDYKAEN